MKPQLRIAAVILAFGTITVSGVIFMRSVTDIRIQSFCYHRGYGWRETHRNGVYCTDSAGRLIPPEKAWGEKPTRATELR